MRTLSWAFFFLHLISDFFSFFFFLSVADHTRKRYSWFPVSIAFSMLLDFYSRFSRADYFLYVNPEITLNLRFTALLWKGGLLYYAWVMYFSLRDNRHAI